MIKKRVAELIDIERDIKPYDAIAIYAGVGSGKNTFIEGYHSDTENYVGLAEKNRVLLITSRRAKVDETKKRDDETNNNFVQYIDTEKWDSIYPNTRSVVCTNAHISKKINETFKLGDESTYFWNSFDYIVIDEFHSLVSDASFTESSFYLTALIEFICKQVHKPKIIFMSATPSPAGFITKKIEPNKLDFRDKAISLKPKRFCTLTKEYVNNSLLDYHKPNEKTVYFATKLSHINDIIEKAPETLKDKIAVVVSDDAYNQKLNKNYNTIYNNGVATIESLKLTETIPENIEILITNSKLKEGINIKTPINYLYIESHILSDIQQMCGRIRNPEFIKNTYLITDAEQFFTKINQIEQEYQFKFGLNAANKYLQETSPNDEKRNLTITYIESTTKYIRYNPFTEKFVKNVLYKNCLKYVADEIKKYDDFMYEIQASLPISEPEYEDYFASNGSSIQFHLPIKNTVNISEALIKSLKSKKNIDLFNYKFNPEDSIWLLDFINKIIKMIEPKKKPFKALGNALRYMKCEKKDLNYSHKKGKKAEFTVVKLESENIES